MSTFTFNSGWSTPTQNKTSSTTVTTPSYTPPAAGCWVIIVVGADATMGSTGNTFALTSSADTTNAPQKLAFGQGGTDANTVSLVVFAHYATTTAARTYTVTDLLGSTAAKVANVFGAYTGSDLPPYNSDLTQVFEWNSSVTAGNTNQAGYISSSDSFPNGCGGAFTLGVIEAPGGTAVTVSSNNGLSSGTSNPLSTVGTTGQGATSNASLYYSVATGSPANVDDPNWYTTCSMSGANDATAIAVRMASFQSSTPISASDSLSASVTETSSIVVTQLAKTTNDALSASVTDVASVVITSYAITASDTLSASATDATSGINITGTLTKTASDTLYARIPGNIAATDNFNRADSTSPGANWVTPTGQVGWQILTNRFVNNGAVTTAARSTTQLTGPTKQYSEMKYAVLPAGTSVLQGPAVNMPANMGTSMADCADFFMLVISGTAQNSWTIRKKLNNNTATGLVSGTVTQAVAANDLIRLERDGDQLIGYQNGVERIRATITSGLALSNEAAALFTGVYGGNNATSAWDDWAGGDLGPVNGDAANINIVTVVTASDTLSAAVTDNRSFGTVAVTASDALSVSVTETTSIAGATNAVAASDTLSVSVTDTSGGIATGGTITVSASDTLSASVTDTSVGTTAATTASDTLSAAVTDNRTFGTVAVTASDTLSASVTDISATMNPRVASDTLSAAVTETAGISGATIVVNASDTLSSTLFDEQAVIDATDFVAPSITATATYTFTATQEGFVANLASNASSSWDSVNGNPAPSLKITRTGKSNIASQSYWELVTTWENLGVQRGGVITAVQLQSAWNRVSTYTGGTGVVVGPYDLRNSGGGIIGTLWAGRNASTVDAGTSIGQQTAFVPNSTDGDSQATVRIRLYNTIGTTSTGNPTVAINDDEITFTIVYTPPIPLSTVDDPVSVSVTDTASVAVVGLQKTASDSLSAAVTDATPTIVVSGLTKSASDTLSASVTETATPAITFKAFSSTDTLSAADTELVMVSTAIPPTTDTLSLSVTETAKVRVASGAFPVYDSDVIYDAAAEYNGGGTIQITGSDTLSASVTEAGGFNTQPITASDALSAAVTDTVSAFTKFVAASDTLSAAVTEATALTLGFSAVDALAASVTEVRGFSTVAVTANDTPTASVTENRNFGTVVVSAADTLTATISEQIGENHWFSAADTLTGQVSESTLRLINGNVIVTANDALGAAVTESVVFAPIARTASDTLSASVTETAVPKAIRSTTDTLSASVTDATVRIALVTTASDTLTARLSAETSTPPVISGKYPSYVFDGAGNPIVAIPYVWDGGAWAELQQLLWNGSAWV